MYPVEGERSIEVEASPDRVWALVADATGMGQWSPDTIPAEWLDAGEGNGPAVIGRRFRETNRMPIVRHTERRPMLREPAFVLLYYRLVNERARLARGVEETLRRLKSAAEAT